jgi:branched-chain amino acid transport system substrate-binding protein
MSKMVETFKRAAATVAVAVAGSMVFGAADAETLKIGVVNSLTGTHSSFDLPANDGLQMAADEINKAGGVSVKGKKYTIQLVTEDAQSKPEFAVSGAQRLLRDDDIKVMFGVLTSGPGMPIANLFAKNEVMYFGGFTLMDTLLGKPGNELLFRTLDADLVVSKAFVPNSVKELGITKLGIALPNEDVSRSIVEIYKPLLESQGVKVGPVEYFQPDTADFAPVLRKFANQGLDGMLIGTVDAMAEAIVRQSVEIGGLPKKFLYRGGSGGPGIKYAKQIDGFSWQILTRDLDYTSDPKVKAWLDRYKAFTKKDLSPSTYWGLTFYDTLFMLSKAMEAAGSTTDLKAIAAKMKDMKYDGVRTMRYDKDGRCLSDFDVGLLKSGKVTSVRAKVE